MVTGRYKWQKHRFYFRYTSEVLKTRTNAVELKRKSVVDIKYKLKLTNIYSKKLSKFNLEKQLNTTRKRKHASYKSKNNIAKNLRNKNTNSQSDPNSGDKYVNTIRHKN